MSEPTQTAGVEQADPSAGRVIASLREVVFGYSPETQVIRTLSADLQPGRVCALIGPNASGKSTLLKLLLGQLSPWSGSIEIGGGSVEQMSYPQRAAIMSYVPQRGGMSFAFTVRQVVEMGRFAMGDRDGVVNRALDRCDLAGMDDRIYSELSGGQQQRVLLARAIAQSEGAGRLMLLDEPASGMDLKHVHQTMRLLREIARGDQNGVRPSVLVVLHDINLAARYADDVWLLDEGELVAAGPCREVLEPQRLASVYEVGFQPIQAPTDGTDSSAGPMFWIDPGGTMA